jgi:hypothetical protein
MELEGRLPTHSSLLSTGWNEWRQFTPEPLHSASEMALRRVKSSVVGSGRILSDGVFHALIVDLMMATPRNWKGRGSAMSESGHSGCAVFYETARFFEALGFSAGESPGMAQENPPAPHRRSRRISFVGTNPMAT